jgi:sulfate permease, SulP family
MNASGRFFVFRPKVLECLAGYNRTRFLKDAMAGLTVGVVALSLCIGLGIASGVTPAAGLYSGIVGGFVVSALGGSRVQIGGPAGAFVGLLLLTVHEVGFANLLICTMLAGVIMFLMGLFRMGSLIRFVPQPVTVGFTCGIAITILTTQIQPFLGLTMAEEPAQFLPKMIALAKAASTVHWPTLALGVLSLGIVTLWPTQWARRVPGSIVAVVVGTLLMVGLRSLWGDAAPAIATIGSRFGGIPRGLPHFALPEFDWSRLDVLMRPAFTIALLGSIESLLSAVVADGLIDDRHDSNQELMAQGVANFTAPLFGGIPVTGVIARTATNIRSGAETPVAGMVHSFFLLGVLLIAAPLARDIPLVSLAAVLIVVALRMGEWDEFRLLNKRPKSDALVFLATFALTVCFDLTLAVEIGMLLAAFLFIHRIAETTQVLAHEDNQSLPAHERLADLPRGVIVYRVFGALMFGAADKLDTVLRRAGADTKVVILSVAAVTAMDSTALDRLEALHEKLRRHGRHLILCGPHTQPFFLMEKAGFLDQVGSENIVADIPTAVSRAKALLGK